MFICGIGGIGYSCVTCHVRNKLCAARCGHPSETVRRVELQNDELSHREVSVPWVILMPPLPDPYPVDPDPVLLLSAVCGKTTVAISSLLCYVTIM